MQREALKYVYDVKVAAEKIQRFTRNKVESDYLVDELLQSGTERQFEIIGEAIGQLYKIDSTAAESIPDFKKMIAFRNILIHGYASVDPVIVLGCRGREPVGFVGTCRLYALRRPLGSHRCV